MDRVTPVEAFCTCGKCESFICPLCTYKFGNEKLVKAGSSADIEAHMVEMHAAIVQDIKDELHFITEVAFKSNTHGLFAILLRLQGNFLLWVCNIASDTKVSIATYDLTLMNPPRLHWLHITCSDKAVSWSGPPLIPKVNLRMAFSKFAYFSASQLLNSAAFKADGDKKILELHVDVSYDCNFI